MTDFYKRCGEIPTVSLEKRRREKVGGGNTPDGVVEDTKAKARALDTLVDNNDLMLASNMDLASMGYSLLPPSMYFYFIDTFPEVLNSFTKAKECIDSVFYDRDRGNIIFRFLRDEDGLEQHSNIVVSTSTLSDDESFQKYLGYALNGGVVKTPSRLSEGIRHFITPKIVFKTPDKIGLRNFLLSIEADLTGEGRNILSGLDVSEIKSISFDPKEEKYYFNVIGDSVTVSYQDFLDLISGKYHIDGTTNEELNIARIHAFEVMLSLLETLPNGFGVYTHELLKYSKRK